MDRRSLLRRWPVVGRPGGTGGTFPRWQAFPRRCARNLCVVPRPNPREFSIPYWGTQYACATPPRWCGTALRIDGQLQPTSDQMVESRKLFDGWVLIWTFASDRGYKSRRRGQLLKQGTVVASLTRWSARDSMGLMFQAIQNAALPLSTTGLQNGR